MTPVNPAVLMQNVSLHYRDGRKAIPALKDISLTIRPGGITGIMGPDTAGKTTLMRILAGLLIPDQGIVEIFGIPAGQFKMTTDRSVGYMPQHFGLYEDLTVLENLNLYASLTGLTAEDRKPSFQRLLQFTSLAPFTGRLAGRLSGGMKQKLGIACALLGQPSLLLLDEPGVGVDPRSRRELWQMVEELADNGMSVIWATSYMDEAAKCPELIVLEKGELLFTGQPQKLAEKANGSVYRIKIAADGPGKRGELAKWSSVPGIVDVMINGDYIRLETGGASAQTARAAIKKAGGMPTPPTLGDAYLAAVGGINKQPSPYTGIPRIENSSLPNIRIAAHELTKKFGSFTAARNITFTVSAGEIVGLLGPNGAGKSTTFRMLCGLLRPSSGSCEVAGVDMIKAGSTARSRLGYMAQNFSLYADISVWENLYIFASLYGLSKKIVRTSGEEMAAALGLGPYLKTRAGNLSLGMKQRLALLCATIHKPPALFLDEPTSGVDIRTRREFWKHISALTAAGTAVLVTTHFLEEAEYCDNIALIYRGEMIRYGSPAAIKSAVSGKTNPDMEEAFIYCIDQYDREHPLYNMSRNQIEI